jgi:glutathione S-transferase
MIKLYHNDMSVCAQKVRMVLCHKGANWESEHLNLRQGDQFKPAFAKISPKSLVPILEHDGKIVRESSVIVEYLEEILPEQPLFPHSPIERSAVRAWLIQLDANLHKDVAVISFCLAFRYQLLERYPDEDSLMGFLAKVPDPDRASTLKDTLINGTQSERLKIAVYAYDKLLNTMQETLAQGPWLVGQDMSATDIGFVPYLDRLEQLGLASWWDDKPQVADWLGRMRATPAYKVGIADWLNEKYLELMSKNAEENWQTINELR